MIVTPAARELRKRGQPVVPRSKPTAPSPRVDDLLSGKGRPTCYNERGAGRFQKTRPDCFWGIRPRLGYHLRVAEKPGDEPNRTTADQAGSLDRVGFYSGTKRANFG